MLPKEHNTKRLPSTRFQLHDNAHPLIKKMYHAYVVHPYILSVASLSRISGVTRETIVRWIDKSEIPHMPNLAAVFDALGFDLVPVHRGTGLMFDQYMQYVESKKNAATIQQNATTPTSSQGVNTD